MIDWPARMPWRVLALSALLTVGAVVGLLRVEPEVDFVDTVPEHEGLDAYRELLDRLDGVRFVAIYMAGDNLRTPDAFDALVLEQADLTQFLEARFPGAFSHQLSAYEGMKGGHYMLEKLATSGNPRPETYSVPDDPVRYQLVRDQILGDDTLDDVLARDGSSALMLFFFATDDNLEARGLSGEVADALTHWDGATTTRGHAASGLLYSSHYTDERNGGDLRLWGLIAGGAVALSLLWVLRRPSRVAFAIVGMAVATAWTFGITGWLGLRVSFLTLFLAPVVMGIGIDGAIHFLHRADESNAREAIRTMAKPIALAGTTTAAGLAVLLFVPNPLFAQIGGIAALGIVVALAATWLVVAPLRALVANRLVRAASGWRRLAKRRPWFLALVLGLSIVSAGIAATATRLESGSAENEFPQDDPIIMLQHRIEAEYGSFQRAYVIVRGDMSDPAALQALLVAADSAARLPLFREATSVVDLLLADEATDEGAVDVALSSLFGPTPIAPTEAERLPQTRAEARAALDRLHADPLWRTLVPFTITPEYDLGVLAITVDPWDSQAQLTALRDALVVLAADVQDDLPGHAVDAGGAPLNRAAVIEQTPANVATATAGVALVVTGILALAWRSRGREGIGVAVAAGVLVLVAALWILAAIPLLDLVYAQTGSNNAALNDMFLLAFAITVAVGVDDLVHMASRFWEARDAGAADPLGDAFEHAGRSIAGTSLTTFVAFAVLSGVYFLQSKNLAILTAAGVAFAYLATVALTPYLLRNTDAPAHQS